MITQLRGLEYMFRLFGIPLEYNELESSTRGWLKIS
jgi:hypothetical protein